MLTSDAKCDTVFVAGGLCTAAPGQFQSVTAHAGIRLIGPKASDDSSTSWSVNITWVAEYPPSGSLPQSDVRPYIYETRRYERRFTLYSIDYEE